MYFFRIEPLTADVKAAKISPARGSLFLFWILTVRFVFVFLLPPALALKAFQYYVFEMNNFFQRVSLYFSIGEEGINKILTGAGAFPILGLIYAIIIWRKTRKSWLEQSARTTEHSLS